MPNPAYTPPQHYHDMDGNLKSFTYVDHDKKTKIPVSNSDNQEGMTEREYRKSLQARILAINPGYCPMEFRDFVLTGEHLEKLEWNQNMINDEGLLVGRLRELAVIMENRQPTSSITI